MHSSFILKFLTLQVKQVTQTSHAANADMGSTPHIYEGL